MDCYLADAPATDRCTDCTRGLCAAHVARGGGIEAAVFGPFFGDQKPRCDDCRAARFWSGHLGLTAVLTTLLAVTAAVSGRSWEALGVVGIGLVWTIVAGWRRHTFVARTPR